MEEYAGWSDPDLGRAYDLIDTVIGRLHPATAGRIRDMIEQLDCDLETK